MIKLMPSSFHNFKCGEVYCLSPTEYSITCCLCGLKTDLIDFPAHFQEQHLSSDDKSKSPKRKGPPTSAPITRSKKSDGESKYLHFSPEKVDIKAEAGGDEVEEVSAFSWADQFQDDELPIDMPLVEDVNLEHMEHNTKNTFEKELNSLLDIGEQGAKVDVYGGDEDDDIEIGVENDEWLHEKYSYINVPSDDEESALLDDLPLMNVKIDLYDLQDEECFDDLKQVNHLANITNSAKCEFCDRTFYSEVGLKIHVKAVHEIKRKKARKEKKTSEPPTTYTCDDCGDKFPSERQLKFHRYKHTGIICEVCGKSFTQVGNLERHKIRHTGVKSIQCQECDKTFFTDKELTAHMIRHTGVHPHICEVCGKPCRDRGVLTAHMRRHTGERPAKCNVCGKSFFCGYDLNVHSVTHTTERPFKCDICGSTFQLKKSLRVHKKIHSKNRDHVCKICGKGFAQSSGLHAHMRMHDTANTSDVSDIRKLYENNESGNSGDDVVHVATNASHAAIADLSLGQQSTSQWHGLGII